MMTRWRTWLWRDVDPQACASMPILKTVVSDTYVEQRGDTPAVERTDECTGQWKPMALLHLVLPQCVAPSWHASP